MRAGAATTIDIVLGMALILIVLEATRRTLGLSLVFVSLALLIYTIYGRKFPGPLFLRACSLFTFWRGYWGPFISGKWYLWFSISCWRLVLERFVTTRSGIWDWSEIQKGNIDLYPFCTYPGSGLRGKTTGFSEEAKSILKRMLALRTSSAYEQVPPWGMVRMATFRMAISVSQWSGM